MYTNCDGDLLSTLAASGRPHRLSSLPPKPNPRFPLHLRSRRKEVEHMRNSCNKQGSGPSADRLLSIDETCAYLNVSRATLYRLIRQGKIRTYRILTRSSRIRLTELDGFIAGTLECPHTPSTP